MGKIDNCGRKLRDFGDGWRTLVLNRQLSRAAVSACSMEAMKYLKLPCLVLRVESGITKSIAVLRLGQIGNQ